VHDCLSDPSHGDIGAVLMTDYLGYGNKCARGRFLLHRAGHGWGIRLGRPVFARCAVERARPRAEVNDAIATIPGASRVLLDSVCGQWEQAFSFDAGKTWEINWIMTFTRDSAG
jgi:hypothetical protein